MGILLLTLGAMWLAVKVLVGIGGVVIVVVLVGVIGGIFYYRATMRSKRLAHLRRKYADETVVQGILNHRYWEGQTAVQLMDSLGSPATVDNNLLKTRKREVWKYQPNGVNRFRLRITLDDDVVVSWDQKN